MCLCVINDITYLIKMHPLQFSHIDLSPQLWSATTLNSWTPV